MKKIAKKYIYNDDEKDLIDRIERYCAYTERCEYDVVKKLKSWEVPSELYPKIVQHLKDCRYIEEERYTSMFVRGKFKLKGWGRQKIKTELSLKNIDDDTIEKSIEEIDNNLYIDKLHQLLSAKQKNTKATSSFELKAKLTRYALQKGFEYSYINDWLKSHIEE